MPSANTCVRQNSSPARRHFNPLRAECEEGSISESQDFSKANESVLIWFSSLMHFYVKGSKCSFNGSGPVREAEVSSLSCFFQTSLHKAP